MEKHTSKMPIHTDPISVRTTRLNNILVGNGVTYKSTSGRVVSVGCTPSNALSASVVETINREGLLDAFSLLYNECDKDTLKKRDRNIADFVRKFRPVIEETRKLRVNADDFESKALIGRGYFGDVHLVLERQTGDVYAMKKIQKSKVTMSQVKEERDIMSRRCSEWIIKLQYAFQDNANLYLVMEYLPGGDLFNLMSRHGPLDEELARFYLAELTLAINTLHSIGYVHRDIKPENILIDRFGHLKLADFGNAAALDRDGHVITVTPVGTPDYIAPELLQSVSLYQVTKKMHDVSCDFWSMGIIGYELICETTPFQEDDVNETYTKILGYLNSSTFTEPILFPEDVCLSENYKNLIEMLVTCPENRLHYDQIVQHPFFEGVKWEILRSQVPPIIPVVTSEDDVTNFTSNGAVAKKSTYHKKSINTNIRSNDFSGTDLPYIGYSFVHMEKQKDSVEDGAMDDARFGKLKAKINDLQGQLKARLDDIYRLKKDLFRSEEMAKKSDLQTKVLDDAKAEITKMKNIIIEKTTELTACKMKIKTLINSLKIEEENWVKKEATITNMLRLNRKKFEDAKIASEIRYEKVLSERKLEITNTMQKLNARESELVAKNSECLHLEGKVSNYKDIIRQLREKSEADKAEFERNNLELSQTYEAKLQQLRTELHTANETNSELQTKLRDLRDELRDSINSTKTTQEVKNAAEKSNDEILRRLNSEINLNNQLHNTNSQLEQKLAAAQKDKEDLNRQVGQLEREIQVLECGKSLAESELAKHESPYETAPGSLTELHSIEDQLHTDLEAAKEAAEEQRLRADELQKVIDLLQSELEVMMSSTYSGSPAKYTPNPAPRQQTQHNHPHDSSQHEPQTEANTFNNVGDLLQKRNEKLENQLVEVREAMIVERQAARTANLNLWKTEKKLTEALDEKKLTQRRMELTEDRIKKVKGERDEAQRLCKAAEEETKQRDTQIIELREEIAALERDIHKEHALWEIAERERMQNKSEVIEQIGNVHKLEQHVSEMREKLQQSENQLKTLTAENKRLMQEQKEAQAQNTKACDEISKLQFDLKNLRDNYERLKYACTLTDKQLTEVETMLEAEQARSKEYQVHVKNLYDNIRDKDAEIAKLKGDLNETETKQKVAEGRIASLEQELVEQRDHFKELHKKFISQQQQLIQHVNEQFETQQRINMMSDDTQQMRTLAANNEREIANLKEENTRILSDLFHANSECHRLQCELKDMVATEVEIRREIEELQGELSEKESFYLQRDIKSETTLAQHKKLIDYLQLKVEDLSHKKKKTLSNMIFGTSTSSSSTSLKKELSNVESSIMYRTLQEELRREKQRCKTLQEQIDSNKQTSTTSVPRTPLKEHNKENRCNDGTATKSKPFKSPQKQSAITSDLPNHRFELTMQENSGPDGTVCIVCEKAILCGSPCWNCKQCASFTHRKCHGGVTTSCCDAILLKRQLETLVASAASDQSDAQSVDQYSYKAQVEDHDQGGEQNSQQEQCETKGARLLLKTDSLTIGGEAFFYDIKVNCGYEVEEEKILLLGCNSGLYSCHLDQCDNLIQISGINSVTCMAVSHQFAKAIIIGSLGEALYQYDYRQLQSRSLSNKSSVKPALEACVLDFKFGKTNEVWQVVKISDETSPSSESVAIGVTSERIVIFKYDLMIQKFRPVRALDTASTVSSILFTRFSVIVSSEKFFEIDLNTYSAEEFLDEADKSLMLAHTYQPVEAIRISQQEFLLCFMEGGVFVDEFGCRSRPYQLHWEHTPTGFHYGEPFLYVAHCEYLQILRLHRSYAEEQADTRGKMPVFKRIDIPLYMSTIISNSGKTDAYVCALRKTNGRQQIYHISPLDAFKENGSESLETLSSIGTSLTTGSIANMESL